MFQDEDLQNYIKTNNTLSIESFVVAEWNLNDLENVANYGNYRYRPTSASVQFRTVPNSFDPNDVGNYYTGGLDSTKASEFLTDKDDALIKFIEPEKNRELLFSLKECFQPFRPRSGINKLMWFNNKYIDNIRSARRPRYYMASRDDEFKYWSSYRKEENTELGLSSTIQSNNVGHPIEDAVPFVVYNNPVPANRIVVKMQTNLAETSRGEIRTPDGETITDPLANRDKSSIPKRWAIQYLDSQDNWVEAATFDENSTRIDGSNIVSWDGYVELYYGIRIPEEYKEQFNLVDYLSASTQLPLGFMNGESYLVGGNESNLGSLYTWNTGLSDWDVSTPDYGFSLLEDNDVKRTGLVRELTSPKYVDLDGRRVYRDIVYLKGLRLVVETLNGPETTFDLIELSPRLKADISNYVSDFEINKIMSNDSTGLPVGGLLASNGNLNLMNYDSAFSEQNENSIVASYLKPNVKFDFYETILDVNGYDKFVPLKTFYAEDFPKVAGGINDVPITLRDFFFRLETTKAPNLFLQNTTLTSAIAILLDNIGFSNYVFSTITNATDPVIPYFFVEPDVSVAEVLQRLAVSTQTAMFFDEYNNFVLMSKEYLLPESGVRSTNLEILGETSEKGIVNLSNIDSAEVTIINSGNINYTTRYIQRSPGSFKQGQYFDEDRTYIYKPVLLWEVASDQQQKTINEKAKNAQGYALGAVPINANLSSTPPNVVNRVVVNNVIDLGENVYWLPRFQGYLYANGEIIRYDAVEYAISGSQKQWITSNQEYQKYFGNLPFNGKMYPTGNIRIYSEPHYQVLNPGEVNEQVVFQNGEVKAHGRGQFGTQITEHYSGLSTYWSDNSNVRGCVMKSEYLFNTKPVDKISFPTFPALGDAVGVSNTSAQQSTRTGIIANFNRESIPTDDALKTPKSTDSAVVQSSALVFAGPTPIPQGIKPRDLVSYVYKEIDNDYTHFGTRMRIVGKKGSSTGSQTPLNSTEYFTVTSTTDQQSTLSGGSGGLGIMINPDKNYGYFFEIMSLTTDNLQQFTTQNETTGETTVIHNIIFYKVIPGTVDGATVAVPKKLWGGIGKILVDEGTLVGQDRLTAQSNPTVYDLAVEYEDIGSVRRFYLYINNAIVATVDDVSPLPWYNGMALFTRGSSKCMFENIYALKNVQQQDVGATLVKNLRNEFGRLTATSISQVFGDDELTSSESLRKYSISGLIQSTLLSGISSGAAPKYKIYFEEFGTIFRECAYFNIRYDQAYPALVAAIAPSLSKEKSFTISGFRAGSYGAEFLIFNNTDKLMALDETTGNYLRIFGVTFTQNTSNVLTVDDFFRKRSDYSDPIYVNNTLYSPQVAQKTYQNIQLSRSKYGKREFSLDSPYIQNDDTANGLMSWIVNKTLRQRKKIGLETFGTSHLQLGDLVTIDYTLPDGYKFVDPETQFVVSSISYRRDQNGPNTAIKVVEV